MLDMKPGRDQPDRSSPITCPNLYQSFIPGRGLVPANVAARNIVQTVISDSTVAMRIQTSALQLT